MEIEIWSDVVCPWCYIGKRRFERALAAFDHRGEVNVTWRSFQLDPSAAASLDGDPIDRLAAKYGLSRAAAEAAQARVTSNAATEGLEFHLDRARWQHVRRPPSDPLRAVRRSAGRSQGTPPGSLLRRGSCDR